MKEISMPILKRIRVIKKIQEGGAWRFVSLKRAGKRYVWDPRPGTYYLDWWDGGQRLREVAGDTSSQVIAAQRRKQIGGRSSRRTGCEAPGGREAEIIDPHRGGQGDVLGVPLRTLEPAS